MKYYVSSFNGILDDLKAQIGPSHLATPRDADCWVWWQDVQGSYGDLMKACRQAGFYKPTFTVQHGRAATLDYGPPNSFPFLSDWFLCWGRSDYKRMCELGYGSRTHIVGCPLNSHIKPKVAHSEKVVLFVPVNTGKEEPENIAAYYEMLQLKYRKAGVRVINAKDILKDKWNMTFNNLSQDFDVVAKLLPWHDKTLYHGRVLVGQQDTFRNNQMVFELLRNVDAVVGLDEGCTEVFAYGHDVPVIVVEGFTYRQHKSDGRKFALMDTYRTKASLRVPLDSLSDAITETLAHPEALRTERAEVAEAELGLSYGDATHNIHRFIREKVKTLAKA